MFHVSDCFRVEPVCNSDQSDVRERVLGEEGKVSSLTTRDTKEVMASFLLNGVMPARMAAILRS